MGRKKSQNSRRRVATPELPALAWQREEAAAEGKERPGKGGIPGAPPATDRRTPGGTRGGNREAPAPPAPPLSPPGRLRTPAPAVPPPLRRRRPRADPAPLSTAPHPPSLPPLAGRRASRTTSRRGRPRTSSRSRSIRGRESPRRRTPPTSDFEMEIEMRSLTIYTLIERPEFTDGKVRYSLLASHGTEYAKRRLTIGFPTEDPSVVRSNLDR